MVKVALDFDDTYTKDPSTWQALVSKMKESGWEVRFVTFRDDFGGYNNHDIVAAAGAMELEIIYTAGKQKKPFCAMVGFEPDFWIDDMPHIIPSAVELAGMTYGCVKNNDCGG